MSKNLIFILMGLLAQTVFAEPLTSNNEEARRQVALTMQQERQKINALINAGNLTSPQPQIDTSVSNPAFSLANNPANNPQLMRDLNQGFLTASKIMQNGGAKFVQSKPKHELFVMVSFSMPDDTLRLYSEQAKKIGATIVLRGFYQGSLTKTQLRALSVNKVGANWQISPSLFKKFKVTTVPVIVLSDSLNGSVLEDGCAKESDYLKVEGDVSFVQALVTMQQFAQGPLSATARLMVNNIEQGKKAIP